ncbi:MAG: hypothetical protein KA715_12930 [Xanthomonadaceae bacterium]|nr:hypothetical protein [Xanthomonadaceae bacterium]
MKILSLGILIIGSNAFALDFDDYKHWYNNGNKTKFTKNAPDETDRLSRSTPQCTFAVHSPPRSENASAIAIEPTKNGDILVFGSVTTIGDSRARKMLAKLTSNSESDSDLILGIRKNNLDVYEDAAAPVRILIRSGYRDLYFKIETVSVSEKLKNLHTEDV